MAKPVGWRFESLRHRLSAKGISTSTWREGKNTKRFPKGANYSVPFAVLRDNNAADIFVLLAFSKEGMLPEEIAEKMYIKPSKRNTTFVTKKLEEMEAWGWAHRTSKASNALWDVS